MEDFASLTCSSVFSDFLGLINSFCFHLPICSFSPRKSCDYVYRLPLQGELIDAFSRLWIAFSICFCLPASGCSSACFCIFLQYFLTILYYFCMLYIHQSFHFCHMWSFLQICEIAVVSYLVSPHRQSRQKDEGFSSGPREVPEPVVWSVSPDSVPQLLALRLAYQSWVDVVMIFKTASSLGNTNFHRLGWYQFKKKKKKKLFLQLNIKESLEKCRKIDKNFFGRNF